MILTYICFVASVVFLYFARFVSLLLYHVIHVQPVFVILCPNISLSLMPKYSSLSCCITFTLIKHILRLFPINFPQLTVFRREKQTLCFFYSGATCHIPKTELLVPS